MTALLRGYEAVPRGNGRFSPATAGYSSNGGESVVLASNNGAPSFSADVAMSPFPDAIDVMRGFPQVRKWEQSIMEEMASS